VPVVKAVFVFYR